MKNEKFLVLESLRGIAAISVAFFHFNVESHFSNAFFANAWLMVDFFFVLSGFVITFNYFDKITNLESLIKFQVKRFLRLYPLHLVMLVIFVAIEIAKYIVEIKLNIVADNQAFSSNNLFALLANLLLIHSWILSDLTYNYPSWSISAEFITYALFAILILSTKANKFIISAILFLLIILSGVLLDNLGMEAGNLIGPLRCVYSFSIGSLILFIYREYNKKFRCINQTIPLIFIILSVYSVSIYGSKEFEYITLIPILFGVTILSIAVNRKDSLFSKILSMDWLVYLGKISYGIYMIHACIWWIISQIFKFILNIPIERDGMGHTKVMTENIYVADSILIFGISLILILAHFSHKYFETRFTKKPVPKLVVYQ